MDVSFIHELAAKDGVYQEAARAYSRGEMTIEDFHTVMMNTYKKIFDNLRQIVSPRRRAKHA